jgi:uncharacterized repeat protein (TIGR03803 family)
MDSCQQLRAFVSRNALLMSLALFLPAIAFAQGEKVVFNLFEANTGNIVADSSGNIYASFVGQEVFELSPAASGWSYKAIAETPGTVSSLLIAPGGIIYGTTSNGGDVVTSCPTGCGTVFKLTPPTSAGGTWGEGTILSFTRGSNGGVAPSPNGLTLGKGGVLYGEATMGGDPASPYGAIFALHPPTQSNPSWTYDSLYEFLGGADGFYPYGTLTFDTAGNLYGTTLAGGVKQDGCNSFGYESCGTAFELSPGSNGGAWTKSTIYSFQGPGTDGSNPMGGMLIDASGNLYGVTRLGGTSAAGAGTVFKLTPATSSGGSWTETLLYNFKGKPDANQPLGIIQVPGGNMYGAAMSGGADNDGAVFQMTPLTGGAWSESVVYTFNTLNSGIDPDTNVIYFNNALYGATSEGGLAGSCGAPCGVIYQLSK